MKPRFCSIGSINMDLVVKVDRFPFPGETLTGKTFNTFPGGKGSNQAVALSRLGADVCMAGMVGDDSFGKEYLEHLAASGVDIATVKTVPECSTGVAIIEVDSTAENHIVIVPGANGNVDKGFAHEVLESLGDIDMFLLQLEIPLDTVEFILKELKKRRKRVVLDPAPMTDKENFDRLVPYLDIVTPNETEMKLLTDVEVTDIESAKKAGKLLLSRGVQSVIIKAGGRGSYIVSPEGAKHVPAFSIMVTDTTGAGDSFNAGLAYALGEGKRMEDAVLFASAVGGLACSAFGAQSSMPELSAVLDLLNTAE
ncbi:ribokinase [Marispirochaeta sp.]|uniref:ribokinase n=1 Tax=Marispirochaeta sp. TaxID=2038653 RepID=UPI0029C8BB52|nr:ribokinase [Marispirochaeta sp.]